MAAAVRSHSSALLSSSLQSSLRAGMYDAIHAGVKPDETSLNKRPRVFEHSS